MTYHALAQRIRAVAAMTGGALGAEAGDRIGLLAPNCLEYPELVAGISASGAAVVTLNPRLVEPELRTILEDAEVTALIVHPALEAMGRTLTAALELRDPIILGAAYEALLEQARAETDLPEVPETATFAIAYTSGTTGRPKGVALPHRSRVLTIGAMAAEYGCFGPDDTALVVAPMFHGAGLAFALAPLVFGGTIEVLPGFDAEHVLRRLASGELTNTFLVPTHFHALFAVADGLPDLRPRGIRTVVSGAAALPQATKERVVEMFGGEALHECFGSTEGGIVTNLRPRDQLRKSKCVGLPFPMTRVRLLGLDSQSVAPGEIGEIVSWSPYLFNGYWRQHEATAESLRQGWHSAGDLGRFDEEGYLYIEGRKKEMIISGGVNIFPREIEEVLHRHPAIADAGVVGLPDAYWGEMVAAAIVLRQGADDSDAALEAFCAASLARFKIPRRFVRLASLPRNAAGKVLKHELRDVLRAAIATENEDSK